MIKIYSIIAIQTNNKYIFPLDFFDSPPEKGEEKSSKVPQKQHPKIINPANTIKIKIPSKVNEIKEIKEETIEESIENSQIQPIKKNNLKIVIPENSNDEMEPSTSGSKISQNTPSNSPLIYMEKNKKNEEKKIILLNKNDNNIIKDEELLKITPHFINENKASSESVKVEYCLKRPITPNIFNSKKMNSPLTCDNKCFVNYKFNFNFETKENGAISPKDKWEEKKIKKIPNGFRIGNKNKYKKIKI